MYDSLALSGTAGHDARSGVSSHRNGTQLNHSACHETVRTPEKELLRSMPSHSLIRIKVVDRRHEDSRR